MSDRVVYPDCPFFAIAWRDCLTWAIQDPDVLAEYTRDTGVVFNLAANPIDKMVDAATGHEPAAHFIDWFNANIWGADPFVRGVPSFADESVPSNHGEVDK